MIDCLVYELTYRKHEAEAERLAIRFGRQLPEEYTNKVSLLTYVELGWRCFWDVRRGLDDCMPTRWADAQHWCDTYDTVGSQALAVHDIVRTLDVKFVELAIARREERRAAEKREQERVNQRGGKR